MKNILFLGVTVALGCLVYDAVNRVPPPAVAPVVVQAPVVPPPVRQKMFYHSPLDAAPMAPGQSTGMGYYSTSEESRFNGAAPGTYSSNYAGGTTNVYGNSRAIPTGQSGTVEAARVSSAQANQNVSRLVQRELHVATPSPLGTAR